MLVLGFKQATGEQPPKPAGKFIDTTIIVW